MKTTIIIEYSIKLASGGPLCVINVGPYLDGYRAIQFMQPNTQHTVMFKCMIRTRNNMGLLATRSGFFDLTQLVMITLGVDVQIFFGEQDANFSE